MNDAVWVTVGPAMPCGARIVGDDFGPARDGTTWLDVCTLGQHLPQMYRESEIRPLDAAGCERLGLCPDCLGFGDLAGPAWSMLAAARGIDEVREPCPGCGGTGRPALRITVIRSHHGDVQGSIRPLPHAYVPMAADVDPIMREAFEIPDGMCLACGMPEDGTGPRGEQLHPAADDGGQIPGQLALDDD